MNSHTLREEMQRNAKLNRGDLETLKRWIVGQTDVPLPPDGDLALFLHRNYYDLEATKSNITNFFHMRLQMPEYFDHRDPLTYEALKKSFENVSSIVLPKRTPEGYSVVLIQLLNSDPNLYNFDQAVKYLNMAVDLDVYERGTSNGYLYVCDIRRSTPEHYRRLSLQKLSNFFGYLKKGTHFRWKGMHYINSNPEDAVLNDYLTSKIVNIKFDEQIYLYACMEDLGQVVPLDLLPYELGGSTGRLQELHEAQFKKIKYHKGWMKMDSWMRMNKNKV